MPYNKNTLLVGYLDKLEGISHKKTQGFNFFILCL